MNKAEIIFQAAVLGGLEKSDRTMKMHESYGKNGRTKAKRTGIKVTVMTRQYRHGSGRCE